MTEVKVIEYYKKSLDYGNSRMYVVDKQLDEVITQLMFSKRKRKTLDPKVMEALTVLGVTFKEVTSEGK